MAHEARLAAAHTRMVGTFVRCRSRPTGSICVLTMALAFATWPPCDTISRNGDGALLDPHPGPKLELGGSRPPDIQIARPGPTGYASFSTEWCRKCCFGCYRTGARCYRRSGSSGPDPISGSRGMHSLQGDTNQLPRHHGAPRRASRPALQCVPESSVRARASSGISAWIAAQLASARLGRRWIREERARAGRCARRLRCAEGQELALGASSMRVIAASSDRSDARCPPQA